MGVTINALIVGVRNSAGDSYTQTLNVRIVSAKSTYTTYGQFEQAHPDTLTYEQWRVLFPATETDADFNNEPMRGATLRPHLTPRVCLSSPHRTRSPPPATGSAKT